ncbi:uncharacterized protein LOC118404733 [Branchiostoma floridae]|uniref:Uncharacterized protein LOC118404733 n=1 Tax=Branchiostoma floridae TaxID=7739 RepID=A0A9J7KI80_BRAFL|nr:uncharacterized protein LOC118404733 [Branchiostoma floridae]
MAAEYEEQVETTEQSTVNLWNLAEDTPTALPRGVGSKVGNAGGNTGIVTTLGWESDWTTMMYLGAGLGAVILILAIFVCCLLREREKQEVIRRAQLEAAYRVMVPLWGPRETVLLQAPSVKNGHAHPWRYPACPPREQVIV